MAEDPSFQEWIERLAAGDDAAAQWVWNTYFPRLVTFARRRLADLPRRAFDEEDIALSALGAFVRGVEAEQFPDLNDPDNLWRVLATITARKVVAQRRKLGAAKRGENQVRGESVFIAAGGDSKSPGLGGVSGDDPSPDFEVMMVENCEQLLRRLDSEELRDVARLRLEGHTNEEIAAQLGCSLRTVERRLNDVRRAWSHVLTGDDDTPDPRRDELVELLALGLTGRHVPEGQETVGDLLQSARPDAGLLNDVKQLCKLELTAQPTQARNEALLIVYHAAIAAAWLKCGTRISSLSDEELARAWRVSSQAGWADENLTDLCRAALRKLRP